MATCKNFEKIQENISRKLMCGSSTVTRVVVRGDLGWKKLERMEEKIIIWMEVAENE